MKTVNKLDYAYYKLLQISQKYKNDTIEVTEAEYKKMNFNYELVFEEKFINNTFDHDIWFVAPAGPSYWNMNMGGIPEIITNNEDGTFMRLNCIKSGDNSLASGLKTYIAYGDGRFECEARFNSGLSTWPAIWMTHPNGSANNYEHYHEIDLSEYYETRDVTEVTYHCPSSMRGGSLWIPQAKPIINKTNWNKFECYWDDDSMIVCVNNKQVMNIPNDGDATHFPIDPNVRTFTIILSMQYGNLPWITEPNLNDLPLWMDIRNIKYYRKA